MGTNTLRAKYSRASIDTVATIPKARSRFASGDGLGTEETGESMRYILILLVSSNCRLVLPISEPMGLQLHSSKYARPSASMRMIVEQRVP